jgi:hypothetical protein
MYGGAVELLIQGQSFQISDLAKINDCVMMHEKCVHEKCVH